MSTPFVHQARTRASLLAALLLAAFAAALFLAQPAQAHDELISSSPVNGAVLDTAPSEIELVFSAALMDLGNQVIVEDAAGNNLAQSEPVLNRETLVQALPALDAGEYQVNWRAVSSDGHPITGTFSFTVNAPAGAESPSAAATATATPSPSEAAASPAASEQATEEPAIADSQDVASTSFGAWGWILTIAGAVLLGVIIYAIAAFMKKRRSGAGS